MKTLTISSKGQIAIPKDIRIALQIDVGDKLIYEVKDGKLLLEPAINIPRSQSWFWKKEIQAKINQSENDYNSESYKRYDDIDNFIKDLEDE